MKKIHVKSKIADSQNKNEHKLSFKFLIKIEQRKSLAMRM